MRGLSRKLYLDLSVPTEEDQRSDQQRILEALSAEGVKEEVHIVQYIRRDGGGALYQARRLLDDLLGHIKHRHDDIMLRWLLSRRWQLREHS